MFSVVNSAPSNDQDIADLLVASSSQVINTDEACVVVVQLSFAGWLAEV